MVIVSKYFSFLIKCFSFLTLAGLVLITSPNKTAAQTKQLPTFSLEALMASRKANLEGKPFPAFSAKDLRGNSISLSDLKGKIVFVNFWFEACSPCIAEIGDLNRLYDSVKSNRNILFLSFTNDPVNTTREAVKRLGIRFPVIPVSAEDCYRLNRQSGFPTNLILDTAGISNWSSVGRTADGELFRSVYSKIREELSRLQASGF
jgi:peroxiredoxin